MICCKIVVDFSDPRGNLHTLLQKLGQIGDFLLEDGNLFFSNVDDTNLTETRIRSIISRAGYHNFLIFVYDKEHSPRESDYINGWITDKLVAINYKRYEEQSQAMFRRVAHGLDLLDKELDAFTNVVRANNVEEAEKTQ